MTQYDAPWKEALNVYLDQFLLFAFETIHASIDWNVPVENKEQDLPHLYPDSEAPGRVADKLFRVKLKNTRQFVWVMVHVEVQVTSEQDFPHRMFTCFYRIKDRYQEPVLCIGVIADESQSWRPYEWQQDTFGCSVRFKFPIVKLRDFGDRIEELQESTNPFATIIVAHLRSQQTRNDAAARFAIKFDIVSSLYRKGWQADDVRKLFRFIDWTMDLPEELGLEFKDRLWKLEKENDMPYITSIERIAKSEGHFEGHIEGKIEGEVNGKILILQELLGLPIATREELDAMGAERREEYLQELREQIAKR
jgi:hypothetical protein